MKFPFLPCLKFILTHFLWLSDRLFKHMFLVFYRHTWQVQDKIDANNVAYTTGKLSFHTDYPALHHPPGVRWASTCFPQGRPRTSILYFEPKNLYVSLVNLFLRYGRYYCEVDDYFSVVCEVLSLKQMHTFFSREIFKSIPIIKVSGMCVTSSITCWLLDSKQVT